MHVATYLFPVRGFVTAVSIRSSKVHARSTVVPIVQLVARQIDVEAAPVSLQFRVAAGVLYFFNDMSQRR